jgi:hypothetical protein
MTSIIGILSKNGVVIGADSSITLMQGYERTIEETANKIITIEDQVILVGTGEIGLGQRFEAILKDNWECVKSLPALEIAKSLSNFAINDFERTANAGRGEDGFGYGALVAFPAQGELHLCEFDVINFHPQCATEDLFYSTMGCVQHLTDERISYFKRRIWQAQPDLEQAILCTVLALDIAIETNPGGVKGPAKIVVLEKSNNARGLQIREFSENEIDTYRDIIRKKDAVWTDRDAYGSVRLIDSANTRQDDRINASQRDLGSLVDLLILFDGLKDILYWVFEPVPSRHAHEFVSRLQVLFHNGNKNLFDESDSDLHWAIELLLRVIVNHKSVSKGYVTTTLKASARGFLTYFSRIGFNSSLKGCLDYPPDELLNLLRIDLNGLTTNRRNQSGTNPRNQSLVGLANALVQYLIDVKNSSDYLDIPRDVTNQLRVFIEVYFNNKLKVRLPDPLEKDSITMLKILSEQEWK